MYIANDCSIQPSAIAVYGHRNEITTMPMWSPDNVPYVIGDSVK